ncbi:MAG: VCBS repeat-containing protein, partial [Gemmatimonadaceae bacterium]
ATFLDANGDGHADLLVVSGGNEFWGTADALRSRLYLGDGRGGFRRDASAVPPIFENGSCVAAADFDGDGHVDLFIGSRVVGKQYGLAPASHLLRNDGTGHFTDVTQKVAPDLLHAGMVTSAVWADYDGDGKPDLIVAGEWMPVRVFHQDGGKFVERTTEAGFGATNGWWNSVTAVRVPGRLSPDLLLGNVGLNSPLRATREEPARMSLGDFAHDGGLQQIITSYRDGVSHLLATRDELTRAVPSLKSKYPTYKSFGASRVEDIFSAAERRKATVLEAFDFASAYARNRGNGTFVLETLPAAAQVAPIHAALSDDFDGDGIADLLVAGNFNGVAPVLGRYDASYGLLLRGGRDGKFAAVDMAEDQLVIEGEVRHMAVVRGMDGARMIAVARNDETLALLRVRPAGAPTAHSAGSMTRLGGP